MARRRVGQRGDGAGGGLRAAVREVVPGQRPRGVRAGRGGVVRPREPVADAGGEDGQGREPFRHTGHAGGREEGGGGAGGVLDDAGGLVRQRGPDGGVPAGEDGDERRLAATPEVVGRRGGAVGGGDVAERAAGLQPDEVTEDLVRREPVTRGDGDQLGAEGLPPRGRADVVERVEGGGTEGVDQQAGVAELTRQRLGLLGRRPAAGAEEACLAAGLDRQGGEQAAAEDGRGVGRQPGEGLLGDGDELAGLRRVVGAAPQGRDVVLAHEAGDELDVVRRRGRPDGVEALLARGHETGRARDGQGAEQLGPRAQAGPGGGAHGQGEGGRGALERGVVGAPAPGDGVPQHVLLEPDEGGAGVDAQLVGEQGTGTPERGEGVGRATVAVEGEGEQPVPLLAPRHRLGVGAEGGGGPGGVAVVEPGRGEALDGGEPQLVEPAGLGAGPRALGDVGVRGAAPPGERALEPQDGLAGREAPGGGEVVLGSGGVQGTAGQAQRVAATLGDEQTWGRARRPTRLEDTAQRGDEGPDRRDRALVRHVPEVVDEDAERDGAATGDEQPGEELPRAGGERAEGSVGGAGGGAGGGARGGGVVGPGRVAHLEGAEDPDGGVGGGRVGRHGVGLRRVALIGRSSGTASVVTMTTTEPVPTAAPAVPAPATRPSIPGLTEVDVPVADGVSLHAAAGGSGSPVLLLHGFPQTHLMWRSVAADLVADHAVVAADLRGYGASSAPPEDGPGTYSARTMGRDAVALMRELGHDRFALVGHDRGGLVAVRAALDHPDVVTHLGVLDVLPTLDSWEVLQGRSAAVAFHLYLMAQPPGLPEALVAGAPDVFFGHFLDAWGEGSAWLPDDVRAEYLRASRERVTSVVADFRASAGVDADDDLADRQAGRRLTVPVGVLQQDWGGALGFDPVARWAAWAPDLDHRLTRAGHFMAETAPHEVVALVRDLLAR